MSILCPPMKSNLYRMSHVMLWCLCFILYDLQDMSDFNGTRCTWKHERCKYDPGLVQCYHISNYMGTRICCHYVLGSCFLWDQKLDAALLLSLLERTFALLEFPGGAVFCSWPPLICPLWALAKGHCSFLYIISPQVWA